MIGSQMNPNSDPLPLSTLGQTVAWCIIARHVTMGTQRLSPMGLHREPVHWSLLLGLLFWNGVRRSFVPHFVHRLHGHTTRQSTIIRNCKYSPQFTWSHLRNVDYLGRPQLKYLVSLPHVCECSILIQLNAIVTQLTRCQLSVRTLNISTHLSL